MSTIKVNNVSSKSASDALSFQINAVEKASLSTGGILSATAFDLPIAQYQMRGGSSGGTLGTTWATRALDTEVVDDIGITLSSNQLTLVPVGDYYINATGMGWQCNSHQMSLYNVTGSADLLLSPAVHSGTSVGTPATINGKITLSAISTLELRHISQTTKASDGMGASNTFTSTIGTIAVWTEITLIRLS